MEGGVIVEVPNICGTRKKDLVGMEIWCKWTKLVGIEIGQTYYDGCSYI